MGMSKPLRATLNRVGKSEIRVLNRVRIWAAGPHLPTRDSVKVRHPPGGVNQDIIQKQQQGVNQDILQKQQLKRKGFVDKTIYSRNFFSIFVGAITITSLL